MPQNQVEQSDSQHRGPSHDAAHAVDGQSSHALADTPAAATPAATEAADVAGGTTDDKADGRAPVKVSERRTLFKDFLAGVATSGWRTFISLSPWKRYGIPLGLLIAFLGLRFYGVPDLGQLRAWSESLGGGFVLVFLGLYILITQFPIPRTIFTLSSGVLFGPFIGSIVVLVGTTLSAIVSLTIVRFFLGDWIRPHLNHPAVADINQRLATNGWLAIISLRMIAAVPFSILNYTAALTSVPVLMFGIATLIGSAPGSIATVYLGDVLIQGFQPKFLLVTLGLFSLGSFGLWLDSRFARRQRTD